MTANDFTAYYMVLLLVDVLTSQITIFLLAWRIEDGSLSNLLVQPIHPVLTHVLVNNLAFKALNVMALAPIWAVLYFLFRPVLDLQLVNLLLAVPAVALGFLILFLLGAAITSIAFWTTRVWAIYTFYSAVFTLLAGQFVPLGLLPPVLQSIARLLPFQLSLYFPIQLILGKVPLADAAVNIGLQAVWVVVAYALFQLVWRAGVKRFSAVGA
jgi:ABC-2 type transport system permease protein